MEKKAIVINPHDDDGIISIGGIIIQLLNNGWKIRYVQLCDGCHGSNIMSPEETKKVRAVEIKKEMKFLGIDSYHTYDIEDGTLSSLNEEQKKNIISDLTKQIRDFGASVIFTKRV